MPRFNETAQGGDERDQKSGGEDDEDRAWEEPRQVAPEIGRRGARFTSQDRATGNSGSEIENADSRPQYAFLIEAQNTAHVAVNAMPESEQEAARPIDPRQLRGKTCRAREEDLRPCGGADGQHEVGATAVGARMNQQSSMS